MGPVALVALVVLPAVVGAALLLAGLHRGGRADRFGVPAGVGTAALLATLSVPVAISRPDLTTPFLAGADLGLAVDGLAALVLPTVAVVSLLVLLAAAGSSELRTARFHGLMLLFVAAALMTVLATTLPTLLMSWEVMGATSYALIGYHWRDQVGISSGTTAFLTTRAGDLGLYVAAGAALGGGAGLALADLPSTQGRWLDVVAGGLVLAALGKAAQLPFSFWLSRAMHGPSPVSALLHSAAMVAMGGYLLLRVSPTLAASGWADDVAAWAGALTAVLLGLVALAQSDFKQLLAASTAAQLGFVVLAAGLGATAAGTSHLVAHAAVKAGLFLAAGVWLEALGTRRLTALTGAARIWPLVGACVAAALLSLAGLAPLALWATKDAVLAAAWDRSPLLYVAGLIGALLSAAYAGKALVVLFSRLPSDAEAAWDDDRPGTRTVPIAARLALVPLAVGAVVLGALALPPYAGGVHDLVGGGGPEPSLRELLVSAALALTALLATAALMARRSAVRWPGALTHWLFLEAAAHRLVVGPTVRLAEALARVDDRLLDGVVERSAGWTQRLAAAVARADDHGIDGVVRGVASGARGLGRLAQRPQTGQLHQYYLQAVAVLALALVVLVLVR